MLRDNLRNGVSSLSLKKLQELAAMFRGTFLEGLELPDHDGFQAWLVAEREMFYNSAYRFFVQL